MGTTTNNLNNLNNEQSYFQGLLDLFGVEDIDAVKEILELFIRDMPIKIRELDVTLSPDNIDHVCKVMHGVSNNLSAVRVDSLVSVAREVEQKCREKDIAGSTEGISILIPLLRTALNQAESIIHR